MIILKIEIYNFRSYYKSNIFELGPGLNLIIGSNGDGKTTFYEALYWLFLTDETKKTDAKHISKKRSDELNPEESDDVRVAMTYEHKGNIKTLEKMFHFSKSFDGSITMSNYSFVLYSGSDIERVILKGIEFDRDFPVDIRQYTMFKGEDEIDVLKDSNEKNIGLKKANALQSLIDTFSEVKDFELYCTLMGRNVDWSNKALDHAQKNDKTNAAKIKNLKRTIEQETGIVSEIDKEIRQKEEEATNFDGLLKSIEQSKESSKLLHAINRRIETLNQKRESKQREIDANENYTIYLLDQKWILLGFESIAKEYSRIVSEVDRQRRKLERDYLVTVGADKAIRKIQSDFTPLPVHIPGPQIMQEMLEEEVCKICGRKAPKGSDPWLFMQQKLDEYKASLCVETEDEIPPYYENSYIVELQKKDTTLTDHLDEITKLRHKIITRIASNNKLHDEIRKLDENLQFEFEQKKRILAQTDGLTEEQLLANYDNISNWMDLKHKAENRLDVLKQQRESHRANLEEAKNTLSKTSEGTSAAIYAQIWDMMRHISQSFNYAKELNKKNLLQAIEDEANYYLSKLNTNDFKGTIRILEKSKDKVEAVLMNNDDTRIFNPNTALKTTYLMSILFAIGKLSGQKDGTTFPLVFDAPTSSFSEAKESEFFSVISTLEKQVIIVTKSLLKDAGNGNVYVDMQKVQDIQGKVFRIEKKKPFDDKVLGTIQTVISNIK